MMFFIFPQIMQWFYRRSGLLRDSETGKIRLIYGQNVIRVRRINALSFERQFRPDDDVAELSLILLSTLKKSHFFEGHVFVFASKHSLARSFMFKNGFFVEIDTDQACYLLHQKKRLKDSLVNQIYCITIKKRVRLV